MDTLEDQSRISAIGLDNICFGLPIESATFAHCGVLVPGAVPESSAAVEINRSRSLAAALEIEH